MKFTEVAFTTYPVTNLSRARQFYGQTLGLKETMAYEGKDNKGRDMGWIEYDIGPGTLAIAFGEVIGQPSSDGAWVGLEAENFDEAVKELRQKGVKFISEPMETPVCWMCTIADPDANQITIHKRKS